MKTIVFFTQSLGKTGSEIALYKLLSKGVDGLNVHVVTLYKGEFTGKLPQGISIYNLLVDGINHSFLRRLRNAIRKKQILKKMMDLRADYWYINTIVFPDILSLAKKRSIPVIMHIHELEQMYFSLTEKQTNELIEYSSKIIACSQTAAGVIRVMGRKKDLFVINPSYYKRTAGKTVSLPPAEFLWLMAGSTDANKNPFLFVKVAEKVLQQRKNVAFIWLYSGAENGYLYFCRKYAEQATIADRMIFINPGDDYSSYFHAAYGVLITSYRESFSLVALEALSSGKPVVSTNCGGVSEIITEGTGTIINSSQPEEYAAAIQAYLDGSKPYDKSKALERSLDYAEEIEHEKWLKLIMD